jgi:ATP-dependent RNA helicase UAP56/SUB2
VAAEVDARRLKKERPLVLVGTPGRLRDLLSRRVLDLSGVALLVMDECDKLLDPKFREDVQSIFTQAPQDKQLLLFSATLTGESREVCRKFMPHGREFDLYPAAADGAHPDPSQRELQMDADALKNVSQMFLEVEDRKKAEVLVGLLEKMKYNQVLVFAASHTRAERLCAALARAHLPSAFVHGGMETEDRLQVYRRVMDFHVRILVATDLYGRGIDCPALDLTFNYDMPKDGEQYVHRVGRVGRRVERGRAVSFVSKPEDGAVLEYVGRQYRTRILPFELT